MLEIIIAIVSLVGGWLLNELSTSLRAKPKLRFQMVTTPDDELIEKERRTKTSTSEYGFGNFNLGEKPVVIESVTLLHKKKTIADCILDDSNRAIEPYHNVVYTLMEQEANNLEWHCKQDYFEECDVIANCVDGKRIKSKLEVPLIAIRARFAASQE